jgi:hypothetical protein
VRINYEWKNLLNDLGGDYGFSGLTPKVRNNSIPVIKAIYYPANKTGYWFGDPGSSYSAYGMLAKVIEQRGMDFSGAPLPDNPNQAADPGTITPGVMTRQIVYDYQLTASGLSVEPFYLKSTETWASMGVDAVETHYFVQENTSPRRVEITRPDGVRTVMLSYNAPGQWNNGLIYQDETYAPGQQGVLLGKSFVQWEQGDYGSPRPSRVETTDERSQTTGKEFSYGPRFNQVTETREYGYGYVSGGRTRSCGGLSPNISTTRITRTHNRRTRMSGIIFSTSSRSLIFMTGMESGCHALNIPMINSKELPD